MRILAITNMYPTSPSPSLGTFVKSEVESLRRLGVEVDVLFVNGKKSSVNYLLGFPRLWARLLTRRYDLIHAHYVFCGLIARTQILYPVVLTHHLAGLAPNWHTPLCRAINRFVDRVIDRSLEIKNSPGYEMIEVIPAGIDLELFRPMPQAECRRLLELPPAKKLILWAGDHRRPEKRFDIVTQAMAVLERKVQEAELVLVTGKPQEIVPLYMNACDVLLLVSDGEGSPNVIKEAMACNLPIVSVPVGDVPHVIGGTDGCYLCSQDPSQVAQMLEFALKRGKRTNGRDNVKHLELGVVASRLLSLFEEVVQEKKGRLRAKAS